MGAGSDDRHSLLATHDYHRGLVKRLCEGRKQAYEERCGDLVPSSMFMHCAVDGAFLFEALRFRLLIPLRRNTIAPTLKSEYLTLVHVNRWM